MTTYQPSGSIVLATDGTSWLGTFSHVVRILCEDMLHGGPTEVTARVNDHTVIGTLLAIETDQLVIETPNGKDRYDINDLWAIELS